ncbi:MAG: hypothetical protein HXX10_07745 [Rhodoplanes sp.]|uniref:hypothetical protein n=1 Tax=Rhodoplanes sp. TaxID=1968906 RepID=UPI001798B8D7|nr:hypothetical protein [Rhodoplanes sp.]NVO13914.1 hypothetical protein [Rhodoplanes sp.]
MSAFAGRLSPNLDAFLTQHSGASRPPYAVAGTTWMQIVSSSQWLLNLYTGTLDILIGTYNPLAATFTINASGLGFPTSAVARNDQSPLSLVNGRVVLSQGVNGEGLIKMLGKPTGVYDQAGLVWANGSTSAAAFSLLASQATSLQLLDSAGAEAMRFAATGDIVSKMWGALADQVVQPGTIFFGPWTAAPGGSIKANGATPSRATYARLWAAAQATGKIVTEAVWSAGVWGAFSSGDLSTWFRIPSLNGSFIRGVTDEAAYAIGQYTGDRFASHTHSGTTDGGGVDHSHQTVVSKDGSYAIGSGGPPAAWSSNYGNDRPVTSGGASAYWHAHTFGTSASGTGSETMPRNNALLACIKI